MLQLHTMLEENRVVDLANSGKIEALEQLARLICQSPDVTDPAQFTKAILDRERIMSTGISLGVAVPHAKIATVRDFVMAIGRIPEGLDYDSQDKKPVHLIIMIGAPEQQKDIFLKVLAKVVKLFAQESFRNKVLQAEEAGEVYQLIKDAES
jgi:fructose-specific phosphotransferase system IIA component